MTRQQPYSPSAEIGRETGVHRCIALLLSAFLLIAPQLNAQPEGGIFERYQKVRILLPSVDDLPYLPSLDDHAIDHAKHEETDGKEIAIEAIISESDVRALQQKGIAVSILIPDLQRFYAERAAASLQAHDKSNGSLPQLSSASADATPTNFSLGSVAGYYTLEELANQLQNMHQQYPNLVSEPISIGKSVEGRDIMAVRISAHPESENLPEVLYTGMHHAREPIGMMSLVYAMWSLLEGYSNDPELTDILDDRALWFVPVVNPDGYGYNVEYFPQGGGLWRKNRGGVDGIDLNRNYGTTTTWQVPPPGGIDDPFSGGYRGPAPFSEPETRAIRDFVRAHNFRTALHFHAFSNVLIYSHKGSVPELVDTAWYVTSARELSLENGFGHGRGAEAIGYDAAGTADEWMFNAGKEEGHIFAWVPEVGSNEDGFWPIPDRIPLLCNRVLPMTLRAARMAAPSPAVTGWNTIDADGAKMLELTVGNIGVERMTEGGEIWLEEFAETTTAFPPLGPGESGQIRIALPNTITTRNISRQQLDLRIRYASREQSRRIDAIVHPVSTLFSDDFESSLSRWSPGLWHAETDPNRGRVLSDSPYENYFETDIPNIIELAAPISLLGYDAAELQFEAKAIVRGVQHHLDLEARRSIEKTWHRLDAEYLQRSSINNSEERAEFRGGNRTWANYSVPLDQFAGEDVVIRFVMNTPYTNGPVFDGALIDNLKIVAARPIPTSVADPNLPSLLTVWPNPCRDVLHIQPKNAEPITVQIIDLLGRELTQVSGSSTLSLNTAALPSGAYILTMHSGTEVYRQKILKE